MNDEMRRERTRDKGGNMRYLFILVMISVMQAGSLQAQEQPTKEDYAKWASVCVVVPVFHCVQHLKTGGAIGYFGYDLQCPVDTANTAEVYIDIGDRNLFFPGAKDRGQPKVFSSGEHTDEFEVEFFVIGIVGIEEGVMTFKPFDLFDVEIKDIGDHAVRGFDAAAFFIEDIDEGIFAAVVVL